MQQKYTLRWMAATASVVCAAGANASGFQLQNQNGAGTGLAYAGAAAVAEDASTIFFNPAGMTYLASGTHLSLGGTVIDRSVKFSDTGTMPMPIINPLDNSPVGTLHSIGDNGGDGGSASLVPALYLSRDISPELRVGLGLSVTYGSETEYSDTFAGRFSGRYTSIRQININPALAYKVNDWLSLGGGLNYAKSDIEFRLHTPYPGAPLAVLEGDDSAWGYNLGAMFQLSPQTRLGVSYRSTIKLNLEGTQKVAALAVNYPIKVDMETPDTFSMALSHKLNAQTELLADATWTGWSSVNALKPVHTQTGAATTAPLRYNFEDSWRVGVGVKHQWNADWNLRAGLAYDASPVPNAESRTMTVPDADRTWLAFGARWTMNPSTSVDLGYAHIFFKDASTARAVKNTAETATLQTVIGNFKTSADLFSVQLNHRF